MKLCLGDFQCFSNAEKFGGVHQERSPTTAQLCPHRIRGKAVNGILFRLRAARRYQIILVKNNTFILLRQYWLMS